MAIGYTYPLARQSGTLTPAQAQALLSNPRVVAKRLARLTDQRFVADFLLSGRYEATGGGVFYETGEELFAPGSSEAVEALAEYPLIVLANGDIVAAKTPKLGLGTEISDERISRLGGTPVLRALRRLANQIIKDVDGIGMAVIASKVTDTIASAANWTTVANIVSSLEAAQANREDLALGIEADTIVLKGAQYAKIIGIFAASGLLPRDTAGNPIVAGNFPPNVLGYTWVRTPWLVGSDPLLVDRDQLGGMADEKILSPEWHASGEFNVEARTQRLENGVDGWRATVRRAVVPIVTEAHAGIKITGTAL